RPPRPDVVGTFDERTTLCELLAGIEFNRKSGALAVVTDGGEEGMLLFRDGAPVSCTLGRATGRRAIVALLEAPRGRFVMKLREVTEERRIEETFSRLIIERV